MLVYQKVLLVGDLEHGFYDFPFLGNNTPNWRTPSFFRGVGLNHQPDSVLHCIFFVRSMGDIYWPAQNVFFFQGRPWKVGGYPLDKRPASNKVFFPSHLKVHPAFSGHFEKTDPSLLLTYPLVMLTVCYWSHGPVEIVDLPINSMVIFHSYVKLPEGKPPFSYGFPMIFLWLYH